MHMADALLSPVVGGTLWAATAGTLAWCSTRVRRELDERMVPLMGVLGAFIFAAQMVNFAIPGTGASGHLNGALLLTILLGPHAALLVIASVLFIQALFFADGGLLALGCNLFNLGVFPAFIAYPLIYRPLTSRQSTPARLIAATLLAAVAGSQLGAFAVVLETVASRVSSLPFETFLLLMQPVHLGIGCIEGLVTAAIVSFVGRARPEILQHVRAADPVGAVPLRALLMTFLVTTLLIAGVLVRFASDRPDGLEWSIAGVTGSAELAMADHGVHGTLAWLQKKLAFLPDYGFSPSAVPGPADAVPVQDRRLGTSISGVVGGLITLTLCLVIGIILRQRTQKH